MRVGVETFAGKAVQEIAAIFLLCSVFFFLGGCNGLPKKEPHEDVFMRNIATCLIETSNRIGDVNNDAKVSCIDYAITFKQLWDAMPLTDNECCYIAYCDNEAADFCHLFIAVRRTRQESWSYIEPQYTGIVFMDDAWPGCFSENYTTLRYNDVYLRSSKWKPR